MSRSRLVPVLLSAALLVGAANLGAYAATGGPLLLGKSNTASKTTTLKTTGSGAALSLKSKSGKAPLKVSNDTKIKKLNADLVDGLDSDALETKSFVYNLSSPVVTESYVNFQLPGLPAGRYHVSFSISAGITGTATLFGCLVATGTGLGTTSPVIGMGVNAGGESWFGSGSGYVDTTAATYRLLCQQSGGTAMVVPAAPNFPARIVFTRVDDVTETISNGAGTVSPRAGVIR
jgi:hypothetical protein